MGFWQALSALAPVAPATADAQTLRVQRQQEQQDFAADQALKQAQLTAQKLAAQAEQQKITQGEQPIFIGQPEWVDSAHSYQVLTLDKNTGNLAIKNVPGADPNAEQNAAYKARVNDWVNVHHSKPSPEQDAIIWYTTHGMKPPAELTPFQSLEFNQPKLSMSGGVPTVTYQGKSFTASDLKDPAIPPEVVKLLEGGQKAIDQRDAVTDRRLGMEQRRMDMESQRLAAAMQNSPNGPIPGNSNLVGEDYLASLPPGERMLITRIGTGQIGVKDLGYLLTRNPKKLEEVSQAYPDFDPSKVSSYIDAYHKFTSGAPAEQLKAGANAIQHLYQLKAINDNNPYVEIHNPASAANKRYSQLLNVVTGELAKFYGMPQTNENRKQLRDPLSGLFNRDAAILEQANAMGVAFNDLRSQWENAKPSSHYQAPMPGLNSTALVALKELAPGQYQQFVAGAGGAVESGASRSVTSGNQAGRPPNATGTVTYQGHVYWVDSEGNNLGEKK